MVLDNKWVNHKSIVPLRIRRQAKNIFLEDVESTVGKMSLFSNVIFACQEKIN